MTTPHDNQWEIEALQNLFKATNGIELTMEQAKKVALYEQEKNLGSPRYFFSPWEALDYDEVNLREILSASQFETYVSNRPIQLKQIEERLIEHDSQYLPQLNAAAESLEYYRNVLVPSLRKDLRLFYPALNYESTKVDFLKSEYKRYLENAKKKILVDHFRQSKTFQPIVLKLRLLQHEQICLFPDYPGFRGTMDVATIAVADFLSVMISRISVQLAEATKQTLDALHVFNSTNNAKHIGEVQGWNFTIQPDNEAYGFMPFALFDTGTYTS